jgi:hypothetical protein
MKMACLSLCFAVTPCKVVAQEIEGDSIVIESETAPDSLVAQLSAFTADDVQSHLSFVIDSLCTVSDPTHSLASFFKELDELSAGKDTVISILHLGDSHIQAGFYSGRTMRLLQSRYGNAGRGWISPLRITRTNEPDDYFITTSIKKEWVIGRRTQATPKAPIGPGGVGLQTVSPFVDFNISIAPVNGAGYLFNQAIVYRGPKSMPMLPSGALRDSAEIYEGNHIADLKLIADTIHLDKLTDKLSLQSTRRKQGTDSLLPDASFRNLYFGFNLTNGQPGILYHTVGINGAMFVNFTDPLLVRQMASLRPSLLIISLGTNESFGRRFTIEEFSGQIESFLALVKKYMPHTAILMTTPPECYKRITVNKKRQYVRNENSARAAQAITEVAKKEGLACWDLFQATGGKNSSKSWYDSRLMGRDRIHYTKDAYYEQGKLLYKALMNRKTEIQ